MRLSYPGISQMRRTELMARAQACYAVRRQANDRAEVERCVCTSTPHPNVRRLFTHTLLTSIGRMRTVESRFWTAPQPSYARRRWKKIDTTGRGYIELHQLLDGSIVQGGTCPLQALEYDYEMFATEAGRGVFAAADLDGDGRIDMAGFSKIVHVRSRP